MRDDFWPVDAIDRLRALWGEGHSTDASVSVPGQFLHDHLVTFKRSIA